MKKDIVAVSKSQEEMKNTTSEIKNTLERIKSRLDKAENWISGLEDNIEKTSKTEQQNEIRLKKNEEGLREL